MRARDKEMNIMNMYAEDAWLYPEPFTAGSRFVLACVLLAAFAGCATTGVRQGGAGPGAINTCGTSESGRGKCSRNGVIEITENHEVDPGIRGEFEEAVELLEKEKYPEAIRLLKAVTGKTTDFSAPFINLGIAYRHVGEMENAEKSLTRALEINSGHPVAGNELGLVYRKTGRYQEARDIYRETIVRYPGFLPARKNLGVLCDIYIQDYGCALEQYQEYLKRVPNDKEVKIWIADVKSRMQ